MEEEYLEMKMRGDASVIALLAGTRTIGTERRLWVHLSDWPPVVREDGRRPVYNISDFLGAVFRSALE
jgi:hypothetical protein